MCWPDGMMPLYMTGAVDLTRDLIGRLNTAAKATDE